MASPNKESDHEQDVLHLFKAIAKGKAHLTRFMLAASGPTLLNCFNEEGRTPLMECCYIREEATRVSMVKCIRDAGADVNQKDEYGRTALIHACQQRCNDVVRILIMHCQIIPDAEDCDGNTALIHSASNGNDIAVELLVRNFRRLGLQVDHFNKEGYGALHVAAKEGFLQCAKILATKGKATLTLKDKVSNMTPMEICLSEGYQKSEVDFLKPSVKFYKVAKLTTTMVKYRKKSSSGQDSIGSVAAKISPPKPVDKEKKLKSKLSLLKKVKPQSNNEAGTSSVSAPSASAPPKDKSPGEGNKPANVVEKEKEKEKGMPLLKDMAKKSGQQKYANCSEKKSEVIKLLGVGIKKDGTAGGKQISPMIKRKTDGMIDVNKGAKPQKLTTSNSMTSPFTEKDFPPCDGDDTEDPSSMVTDVTDLDVDDMHTKSDQAGDANTSRTNCSASATTTTAALKNNNNNNNNSNKNKNSSSTTRGLVHSTDFMNITEDECSSRSESNDYESLSDCTLPSMSPSTQTECPDESSVCNDDTDCSSLQTFSSSTKQSSRTENTSHSRWPDSSSPQTEIEYIHLDDDQTNKSHTGSVGNKATALSGTGGSDVNGGSNLPNEEIRPDFDKLLTSHVLKFIDEKSIDNIAENTANGPISTHQSNSNADSTERGNNRQVVNGTTSDSPSPNRNNSASPDTIIENLEALCIPTDIKTKDTDSPVDIIRFTSDSMDSKKRNIDLNESATQC